MKRIGRPVRHLIAGGLLIVGLAISNAQTNSNFTQVKATSEGAIQLFWNSTTNEFYEIDYADELVDTNTGYITWRSLYSDYPSHGTNTFIADCGDYDRTPEISHPKYTLSYFEIVRTLREFLLNGTQPACSKMRLRATRERPPANCLFDVPN